MSLTGALFAGVSGLNAQSQNMAAIGDNLANASSVGYKRNSTRFSTLVTESGAAGTFSPGGVRAAPFAAVGEQGQISTSTSPTDLAVSGNGFFVVNSLSDGTGEFLYTRAGSFVPDSTGNLRNTAGVFLQAWQLDANGAIPATNAALSSVQTINVGQIGGTASPTTRTEFGMNLDADQAISAYVAGDMSLNNVTPALGTSPQFFRTFQIFDSLGSAHNLTVGYIKTATNAWAVEVFANTATEVTAGNGLLESGTITFNGDGTVDATTTAASLTTGSVNATTGELNSTVPITWTNGANASTVQLDWGTDNRTDGVGQFAAPFSVAFVNQNGAAVGQLSSVDVDEEGVVIATFNNGESQRLFKIPLATFADPSSLSSRTGNTYAETDGSGSFNLREAGSSGAGDFVPSALEAANVDIAEEFTDMIVTQRVFSANTRVITTADEMLEELVRIIR
ncbi:MAG: flagellar hook protein FlgE [Alphaproteobacteria bacterium]|jgi:flagellar hook protein FlgE|nr:flagellar hook protein FlgE [Alphaproteobacteria bacterium]MDP6516219.1 flagellar hook protein FlgE [Alphaproteobacteria bacterium]